MTKSRTNADNVTADIAGITAGTGITGGGTSGTVTITNDMATTIAAKGDLLAGTANDAYSALTVGTNGQVLTAASSAATGLEWATPASGSTFSGARVTKSASQSLTSGTWTTITFNTEAFDVGGYHDNSTNTSRLTIPTGKSGYFLVCGQAEFSVGGTLDTIRQVALQKNGVDVQITMFPAFTNVYSDSRVFTAILYAVATDYFEIQCRQDSGSTRNCNGGFEATNFQITYLGA